MTCRATRQIRLLRFILPILRLVVFDASPPPPLTSISASAVRTQKLQVSSNPQLKITSSLKSGHQDTTTQGKCLNRVEEVTRVHVPAMPCFCAPCVPMSVPMHALIDNSTFGLRQGNTTLEWSSLASSFPYRRMTFCIPLLSSTSLLVMMNSTHFFSSKAPSPSYQGATVPPSYRRATVVPRDPFRVCSLTGIFISCCAECFRRLFPVGQSVSLSLIRYTSLDRPSDRDDSTRTGLHSLHVHSRPQLPRKVVFLDHESPGGPTVFPCILRHGLVIYSGHSEECVFSDSVLFFYPETQNTRAQNGVDIPPCVANAHQVESYSNRLLGVVETPQCRVRRTVYR